MVKSLQANLIRKIETTVNFGKVVGIAPPKIEVEINGIKFTLPVLSFAGKRKSFALPSIDEQVIVLCPAGDLEQAFIIGSIFSQKNPPPSSNQDETCLSFDDGSFFTKVDGGKMIISQVGDLYIKATGTININGSIINLN